MLAATRRTKPDRVIAQPKTIGIVAVAALAASVGTLPAVAITATCRRTRSAISADPVNDPSWRKRHARVADPHGGGHHGGRLKIHGVGDAFFGLLTNAN